MFGQQGGYRSPVTDTGRAGLLLIADRNGADRSGALLTMKQALVSEKHCNDDIFTTQNGSTLPSRVR